MSLEITAPSRYMGDLAGQISTKRGRVQIGAAQPATVRGPRRRPQLSEAPELRQRAQEHDRRRRAPSPWNTATTSARRRTIQEAVIAAFKPKAEEE